MTSGAAALDALLAEFQTPRVMQAILSEADRDWFTETLQAGIEQVGSRLEVNNQGVWVVGDRNFVGNATNSIVQFGDNATATYLGSVKTLTIQSAIFQAPPEPGQVDARELLWTYLNRVVIDTGTLDLSGVDRRMLSDQQDTRLELAAVYTSLDTVRSVRERAGRHGMESPTRKEVGDPEWPSESLAEKRQSALAFTAEQPYAALLGDPGGGKTTFANFLALCLAGELLGLDNANLERLGEEWTKEKPGALLPVRVVLRNLAVQLDKLPKEETLWTYITQRLGDSLKGFAPLLTPAPTGRWWVTHPGRAGRGAGSAPSAGAGQAGGHRLPA